MFDFDAGILIKGAGDLASGVAHRLHRAGFRPVMTELAQPLTVRRKVSFSEAVYDGKVEVEGVTAALAADLRTAREMLARGLIPVIVDPDGGVLKEYKPQVMVEATLAKRNTGVSRGDADLVIALGPGYFAGQDVHVVVETMRGHDLGRVILYGAAASDTGEPEPVAGYTGKRLLRAPGDGVFTPVMAIGDTVEAGQTVGRVGSLPVEAAIDGVVRGLLHDGLKVTAGLKIGDVDPRGEREYCFTIGDKARAVGGGVLEALGRFAAGRR